jgi:hypothetical protein
MPSLEPRIKQELVHQILSHANMNRNDLENEGIPLPIRTHIIEKSMLNGLSKKSIQTIVNDLVKCEWVEMNLQHQAIIITNKGKAYRIKLGDFIEGQKFKKTLISNI